MKTKNIAVIIFIVLILAAIGIGVATVYSRYIYKPLGELGLFVAQRINYAPSDSGADRELLNEIDSWAEENNATIIFREMGHRCAGLGFCGYSSWAENNLGVNNYTGEYGVLILDDPEINNAYVNEGVFLPGRAGLEVIGTYSDKKTFRFIADRKFLYPLTAAPSASGIYYTDVSDIKGLEDIFEKYDYYIYGFENRNSITTLEMIHKMFSDSSAVAYGLIGLAFCFVYLVLTLYSDNTRRLWINHTFGLSKRRIMFRIAVLSFAVVSVSSILFAAAYKYGVYGMESRDFQNIISFVLPFNAFLVIFSNALGLTHLLRQFKKRGG